MKRGFADAWLSGEYQGRAKRRDTTPYASRGTVRRVEATAFTPVQELAVKRAVSRGTKDYLKRTADKKFTQDYSGAISVSTSGTVGDLLTNMVEGTGSVDNYLGSEITPTKMIFNWIIDATPNDEETASAYTSVRFMLIQDKGPKILNSVDSYMNLALTNLYPQLALVNQEYDKNWTTLYDSGAISFTTVDGSSNYDGLVKTGRVVIPGKKLRKVFWSDNNDGPDVEKNAIRVLVWSDSGVAPHPIFAYQSQLNFIDF